MVPTTDEAPRSVLANPLNPSLFGNDVEDLALKAVGLAATATVNERILSPQVSKFVPAGSGTVGKLVDAATTAASAWGLGKAIGMLSRRYGDQVEAGGLILAVGKAIAAFVPGLSLSGHLALPAGVPIFGTVAAPAPAAALPAAPAQLMSRFPPNPNYGTVVPQFAVGL